MKNIKRTGWTSYQLNLLITLRGKTELAKRQINEPHKADKAYYRHFKKIFY